jgi:hypothetical protein
MYKRLFFAGLLTLSVSGLIACSANPVTPVFTTSISYVGRMQEHGSVWRSFTVPSNGTVSVQLTSISQSDAVMGLALGTMSGTNCVVSQTVQTAATTTPDSAQITTTLTAGQYCAKLYDIGNLTTMIDFSILITTPY